MRCAHAGEAAVQRSDGRDIAPLHHRRGSAKRNQFLRLRRKQLGRRQQMRGSPPAERRARRVLHLPALHSMPVRPLGGGGGGGGGVRGVLLEDGLVRAGGGAAALLLVGEDAVVRDGVLARRERLLVDLDLVQPLDLLPLKRRHHPLPRRLAKRLVDAGEVLLVLLLAARRRLVLERRELRLPVRLRRAFRVVRAPFAVPAVVVGVVLRDDVADAMLCFVDRSRTHVLELVEGG
mmetsp:Transcript_570/g.1221  ORF Transcript_570/g.1221 Transcript_570/m.1221 type:complete len:234 (+) Transcript_570:362-1063(+)